MISENLQLGTVGTGMGLGVGEEAGVGDDGRVGGWVGDTGGVVGLGWVGLMG